MDDRYRTSELLPLIRSQVRDRLLQSSAFRELSPEKRNAIAYHTVNAIHYIVGGEDGTSRPSSVTVSGPTPLGQALADNPDPAGETAGKRFAQSGAIAAQQGAEAMANLVEQVDFPRFVGRAHRRRLQRDRDVVDQADGGVRGAGEERLEVGRPVHEGQRHARTTPVTTSPSATPSHLEIDICGDKPRLQGARGGRRGEHARLRRRPRAAGAGDLARRRQIEKDLVPAARRAWRMDRQQLLATMVMMGVNRLVVTNGSIEASVLFELDTKDEVKRKMKMKTTGDWAVPARVAVGCRGQLQPRAGGGWSATTKPKSVWYSKGSARSTANFTVTHDAERGLDSQGAICTPSSPAKSTSTSRATTSRWRGWST